MKKIKEQGKIRNRLLIYFRDDSPNKANSYIESIRCTSIDGAQKVLGRRQPESLLGATHYDGQGNGYKMTLFPYQQFKAGQGKGWRE